MFDRKTYLKKYQNNWLKSRRRAWLDLNGPCKHCGSSENLEIDHINPAEKTDHRIWSWSKVRLEEELKKCQVLCRVCHRRKTTAQFKVTEHGTSAMYKHGCRCRACKDKKLEIIYRHRRKKRLVAQEGFEPSTPRL